jgi:hypothetical protein
MKEMSRIRFNPETKEIEIEGSEEFVGTYFDKIQKMVSGLSKKMKEQPKVEKVRPAKTAQKIAKEELGKDDGTGQPVSHFEAVVTLIKGSKKGISTSELMKKTGFTEHQIWSVTSRAFRNGAIKRMKRGIYIA